MIAFARSLLVRRLLVVVGTVVAVAAGSGSASLARPAAPSAHAPTPGLAGSTISLARHMGFDSADADMVTDKSGTAYVAWIGSPGSVKADAAVFLCVLPAGATACKGGVQSTFSSDSISRGSAADLKLMIVARTPTLVWFHDDAASTTNPQGNGSEISEATVSSTGVLSAPTDVSTAPSSGQLLDAEVGPDGSVWTLMYGSAGSTKVQVKDGFAGTPVTLNTPHAVGHGHLAFSHSTPIVAVTEAGGEITPVAYSYRPAATWSKFANVAKTWTVDGDIGLVSTLSGVRLITAVNTSTYYPVVAKWNGHGFNARTLTGDHNSFSPTTHDVVTDRSGRLVDASQEGKQIAVANLADTTHAAIFRFAAGGLVAGPQPQVATTPRGHGWVLWAVEDSVSGGSGDKLMVAPIRLAGLHKTKTAHGSHGTAVLTGVASCMPASTISVGVAGHPKHGWKTKSRTVKLGSSTLGKTLNGASLKAGKAYTLKGSVKFSDGRKHQTVTAKLKFRACPSP